MATVARSRRGGERKRRPPASQEAVRTVNYRNLHNPFAPQKAFSDDQIEAIHTNALRILEELGIKVLLPDARTYFAKAGAIVDNDAQMVRIGRDIVEEALSTAPQAFTIRAGDPKYDVEMALGRLHFMSGAGCPHASDRIRGRRPGSLKDLEEVLRLTDGFDVLPMLNAAVEPQDVPIHERHLRVMRLQHVTSHKVPFIFARGTPQTEDGFEMVRIMRGISREEFEAHPWTKTIINTNSPRQLDIPMAQGIIDFAKARQLLIITPFCLAGAMAPITIAGALSLQHAEALAGISLCQIVRPGAPVMYGSFLSNVDMKSGSPALGTPEQVRATLGSGQLSRRIGLPWRSSSGSASNIGDAQGAHETEISAWAAVMAGASIIVHSAGWLESGLTFGYEKMMTDMDMVHTFAELCAEPVFDDGALAFDAIAETQPGGHFFGGSHTMERYRTAFYEPVVADWSNFGQWTEAGSRTADERATGIWQARLEEYRPPENDPARLEELDAFIARRIAEGGAPPVS